MCIFSFLSFCLEIFVDTVRYTTADVTATRQLVIISSFEKVGETIRQSLRRAQRVPRKLKEQEEKIFARVFFFYG